MKKTLLCLSLAIMSAGFMSLKPANASAKAADAQNQPDPNSYSIVKVQGNPDWTLIPELSAFGTVIGAALSEDGVPLGGEAEA